MKKRKISEEEFRDEYIEGGEGYETGLTILGKIGLISEVTANPIFVSNKVGKRTRIAGFEVSPPKAPLTRLTAPYFQFLDALELMDYAPIGVDEPYLVLSDYVRENGMKFKALFLLARRFYGSGTEEKIWKIIEKGEENGRVQGVASEAAGGE